MVNLQPRWNLNIFAWADEDRLRGFGKLLGAWLDVHRNFCEGGQPDFSWEWGHHERPQIGLLSNAAVAIGGLSIVESWVQKESDGGKKYSGSGDLWLRLSPPASHNDYYAEAKQIYLSVEANLEKSSQDLIQAMNSAKDCARSLKERKQNVVALVFLTLGFADKNLECLDTKTNELISDIWNRRRERDFDAIGGIWMGSKDFERSRQERTRDFGSWKNEYFGVFLVASRIRF